MFSTPSFPIAGCSYNPSQCPCHGTGWILDGRDFYGRCPLHGAEVPHPEDDTTDFDAQAHRLRIHREGWRYYWRMYAEARRQLRLTSSHGAFIHWVHHSIGDKGHKAPMNIKLDHAQALAESYALQAAERSARAEGYSCDLERRMDWEAQDEAQLRR